VELATKIFHSQQAGMLPIAGLFLAGIGLLAFVRNGAAPSKQVSQT